MRLEFEPNVTALPLVENEVFDEIELSGAADFDSLLRKGIAAAQAGDRDHARALLNRAVEVNSSSEDVWMWLASISDYPEELIVFLDHVLEINPENARAIEWRTATGSLMAKTLVARVAAAFEQGSVELAAQLTEQALGHDDGCETAWFWKAVLEDDNEKKAAYFAKVLAINPENTEAREALDELAPKDPDALFTEAKAVAVNGDLATALELVSEYLENSPGNADAWIFRSHLSSGINEKIESLDKALAIDPDNTAARSSRDFLAMTFAPAAIEPEPAIEAAPPESEPVAELAAVDESEVEMPPEAPADLENSAAAYEENHEEFETELDCQSDSAEEITYIADVPTAESINISDVEEGSDLVRQTIDAFSGVDEVAVAEMKTIESAVNPIENVETTVIDEADVDDGDPYATREFRYDDPDVAMTAVQMPGTQQIESATSNKSEFVISEPANFDPSIFDVPPVEPVPSPDSFEAAISHSTQETSSCPFCGASNESQVFECSSCGAVTSISDLELLISSPNVDREAVQTAVTEMEAEWNLREFDGQEMTALAIGHLNLHNYDAGLKYLQEAARLDPNNVILAAQVNTLAIRIDEIQRQSEVHESMPKGKTILVVDDSPTVRKLIAGKLEKSGHNVICAVDGVEALERMAEGCPDLVLLDITMPRMDGYEVCKQIRQDPNSKDVPVVMISGKDGFFDKVRGRMAGTTGYVTKPFGPETLMKALDTYLLPDTGSDS